MSARLRRCGSFALCAAVLFAMAGGADPLPEFRPLPQAHSHNDFLHGRPLLDAIDHGFCSFEADVFLKDGTLLVGHDVDELRPDRTLEGLYLAPLRERVQANGGRVYGGGPTVYLLVDVKDRAATTYAALDELLAKYDDILTKVADGKVDKKAVTVVLSGNRAQEAVRKQAVRYVGIDGRPSDLVNDEPAHLMPWISAHWNDLFRWNGDGPIPKAEREKLRKYVRAAQENDRLVRFWATPEDEAVWQELVAAKVDLIGTDDLPRLRTFLGSRTAR